MKKSFEELLSAADHGAGARCRRPARAQQPACRQAAYAGAIAAAKEILAMKNVNAMYANAVPNIVQRTKDTLLQTNLNYQKDLNEVAVIVAQKTGR